MGSNGRKRTTSSLVSIGGLVVAMVTGAGLWVGHEQGTASNDSGTSDSSSTSGSSDSDSSSTSTGGSGVTQGSQNSSSDATTTGS
ncbi:hypothetical protein [Curtobacterium sp. 458]|uniref:hypothetical protein n=1 Tax=Curtobacterium sp. 458 TaxID=3050069 RepID=UPI0025B542AA|nr:hypothetical protein [Curtobacterium sp. 458]WJX99969.1 hypothetical protein QPJ90_17005 [Curtobacterium sp. 458]